MWKETRSGKTGIVAATHDLVRWSEERGSRDLLIREASVHYEKKLPELREDPGKIVRTSVGGRGWKIDMGI